MRNRALNRLRALLRKERECLLAGQYGELADLARKKPQALHKVIATGSKIGIADVAQIMKRNQELTGIALRAVTTSIEEDAERKARSSELQLYDKGGVRSVDCR